MVQHPEVLWAQRSSESAPEKNIVYLTVNLPNIKASSLEYNLTPTSLHFKATAGDNEKNITEKDYEFDLDFFKDVVPEESTKKLSTRSLYLILRKKEAQEEYWPRLTKEKIRNAFIKTDFSKWVDEDEQDGAAAEPDTGDDDMMSAMGGMGGMGGMPGMGGMGGMPGMGGMGGMPGGMDLEALMAQMNAGGGGASASGGPGLPDDGDDDDSDDDGPPPLEDAEPSK